MQNSKSTFIYGNVSLIFFVAKSALANLLFLTFLFLNSIKNILADA